MRKSFIFLVILLLLTSCKKDETTLPFSLRIKTLHYVKINSETGDTLIDRSYFAQYDWEGNPKLIKFNYPNIDTTTIKFINTLNSNLGLVSTQDIYFGGPLFCKVNNKGQIDSMFSSQFICIGCGGFISKKFNYNSNKIASCYDDELNVNFKNGCNDYIFNGNNLTSFHHYPNDTIERSGVTFNKHTFTYHDFNAPIKNNFHIINTDETFPPGKVWNEHFKDFKPSTFINGINIFGVLPDKLIKTHTIEQINNDNILSSITFNFNYEFDSIGRVIKKTMTNSSGQVVKFWEYGYQN